MNSRKIRVWMLILALIWVTALVQRVTDLAFSDGNQIMTAFASTGAKMEESKLMITGEWTETLTTEEDREKRLISLAKQMGWNQKLEIEKKVESGQTIWYVQWKTNGLESIIQLIYQAEEEKNYCSMEIVLLDQMKDILQYQKKAENIFKQNTKKEYQTTLNFYGEYKGKLSEENQNQQVNVLFHNLHAKEISDIKEDGIYSVYGYTTVIEDYMEVLGNRINLNAVFSYKEEENVTCLSLATPILNEPY